ncbi:MAG: MarR family winged helix-turn-helix transcriptional regulator [Kiritimatiellia bacterium]
MNNADKLDFIFQTATKGRIYVENQVFSPNEGPESLLSDLSAVQLKVSMQILQSQPLSLSNLAGSLGLSNPSASVIVEKLVEKKVVSREPDPGDRRKVQLRIHENAVSEMKGLEKRFHNAFLGIASKVGDENIERWYQVALKINEIIAQETRTS